MIGTRYTLKVYVDRTLEQLVLDTLDIDSFSYEGAYTVSSSLVKTNFGDTPFDAYVVTLTYPEDEEPDQKSTTLNGLLRTCITLINTAFGDEVPLFIDPEVDALDHVPYFIEAPYILSSGDLTSPEVDDELLVSFVGAGHLQVTYQWRRHDVQNYSFEVIDGADNRYYIVTADDIGYRLGCTVTLQGNLDTSATTMSETGKVGTP